MAYSDNFPATRPVFQADFANGGRIDPRATFSRSDTASSGDWNASTNAPGLTDGSGTANQYYRVSVGGTQNLGSGSITYAVGDYVKYSGSVWYKTSQPIGVTYWSNEKHVSSENLVLQSSDFDTAWSKQGLATPTGGQADPAGGTDGFTLVEDSATSFHRVYQSIDATGDLALVVYAKRNSGTRYLNLTIGSSAGGSLGGGLATFDLAGGTPHTSNGSSSTLTNLSATQTASGNGYYKCVFKATAAADISAVHIGLSDSAAPAANNYGLVYYTGDGTSSIDVAFASLSTTGATDYNATTSSIHRQYAPSLKSVATAGQPRFEYTTDGQSIAKGILIEGQSTNIMPYSTNGFNASNAFVWSYDSIVTTENAAVAPSGNLEATLVRENGTTNQHNFYRLITATAAPYTYSIYVKDAGVGHVGFRLLGPSSYGLTFNLSDGSTSALYNPVDSYGYEDVGDGWKRIWVTKTLTAAPHNMMIYLMRGNGSVNYAGDNYSGLLWYGAQIEQSSHPTSYIDTGTSGSAATRALESLSVATADIGYTGGPVSLVTEFDVDAAAPVGSGVVRRFAMAQLGGTEFGLYQATYGGAALLGVAGGSVLTGSSLTAGANKAALSYDTNDVAICANGGAVTTDTSQELIDASGLNFYVGGETGGASALNGHVKRVALYNEALSDTNLQALTS